ncbi:MAG: sugar ABC transporter substrate-binding protein [Lachnospiraceae bacterium]|nr:sugar ABC transporter substrate-binding protein [Lachnospiraceae bacterium]
MIYRNKIISVLLVICLVAGLMVTGLMQKDTTQEEKSIFDNRYKESLILWYADEDLSDYLNCQAVAYLEEYNIKVTPVLVSGLDYLESINQASVATNEIPDIYITNNGNLEKSYLSGLASEVIDKNNFLNEKNFPKAALNAITYQGKKVAYPLYFEAAFFLFNRTYMENFAKDTIEAENDAAEGEEAQEVLSQNISADEVAMGDNSSEITVSDQDIEKKVETVIPTTIDDILNFADEYDAPENVESVFKWDVSDIFYNYFMVGNYISVGGDCGDDENNIDIYNRNSLTCLNVYQDLNQFFSIEPKEVTYDSIIKEFVEGKTVFTIATTDAFGKIEEAKEKGEFQYDYGVAALPDVSSELKSRGLSVTGCSVINGYSQKKEAANDFCVYLSEEGSKTLYSRTNKVSAHLGVVYENPEIENAMLEYEKSVPIPKMVSAESFWVQLEIAFTKIWTGSDTQETLQNMTKGCGYPVDEELVKKISDEYAAAAAAEAAVEAAAEAEAAAAAEEQPE